MALMRSSQGKVVIKAMSGIYFVEVRDFNQVMPDMLTTWLRSTVTYPTVEAAQAAICLGTHPGASVRIVDSLGVPVGNEFPGPSTGPSKPV